RAERRCSFTGSSLELRDQYFSLRGVGVPPRVAPRRLQQRQRGSSSTETKLGASGDPGQLNSVTQLLEALYGTRVALHPLGSAKPVTTPAVKMLLISPLGTSLGCEGLFRASPLEPPQPLAPARSPAYNAPHPSQTRNSTPYTHTARR